MDTRFAVLSLLTATLAGAQEPPSPSVVKPEPAASATPERPPTPSPTTPSATTTLTGTVRGIEIDPRRMVLGRPDGNVTVLLDRNTEVYRQEGTGTLRDLQPGTPVRVSVTNADQRALWVEIQRPEAPASAPAQAGAPGAQQPESDTAHGGKSPKGPPPVAPALPPRAPAGSPPGPGPVPGGTTGTDARTGTAPGR